MSKNNEEPEVGVENAEETDIFQNEIEANEAALEEIQRRELQGMFRRDGKKGEKEQPLSEEAEEGTDESDSADEGDTETEERSDESVEEDGKKITEFAELKAANKALEDKIEALTKMITSKETPEEPVEPDEEALKEATKFEAMEILTDEEYGEAMETREGFNKAMNKVASKAIEFTIRSSTAYMEKVVDRAVASRLLVKDFFKDNPDLLEHRKSVGTTYKLVKSEHPDWSEEQVFQNLADTVRTLKGIKKIEKESVKTKTPVKNPASGATRFAGTGQQKTVTPKKPTDVASQIRAMKGR